jgi:competence protein ComEC
VSFITRPVFQVRTRRRCAARFLTALFGRATTGLRHYLCGVFLRHDSAICLAGFIAGVACTLLLHQLPHWSLPCALAVSVLACFGNRAVARLPIAVLIGFAWACFNFNAQRDDVFPSSLERQDLRVVGHVVGLPNQQSAVTKFDLQIRRALAHPSLVGQRIRLSCYRCQWQVKPGQVWQFTVRLKRPHGFASWGAFDYERFLFRHQIRAKGYVRSKTYANLISEELSFGAGWRASLRQALDDVLTESNGKSIMLALVIGDKSRLDPSLREAFQATGVAHLMAISGLHIGLVFAATLVGYRLLSWPVARWHTVIPRQTVALVPALIMSIIYAALAGFAVSTQRALLMLMVYCLCQLSARPQSLLRVLLIAVALLLVWDVNSILDMGFWLSCGAVVIIAMASAGVHQLRLVRVQLALWVGMLPLSLLFFGQVSIVSPLVNLLAVPLFCVVLIPATLLANLLLTIGLGVIAQPVLKGLVEVYGFVADSLIAISELKLAAVPIPSLGVTEWCVLALIYSSAKYRWWLPQIFTVLFLLIVVVQRPNSMPLGDMTLTLLDVGQGLAIVIETSEGVVIYDTGPRYSTGFSTAQAVLLPYLRAKGHRGIDVLVVSHADTDHIGGLSDLIKAMPIGARYSSRLDRVSSATACEAGIGWQMGATNFSFIGPDSHTPKGSNNRSCVLAIEHYNQRILLTGDIEKAVERDLIRRYDELLPADVMLVPHQGSKTSSTDAFIDAVSPTLALVAAGYRNHYGHPHPNVLERYHLRDIEVLSTVESGTCTTMLSTQQQDTVLRDRIKPILGQLAK